MSYPEELQIGEGNSLVISDTKRTQKKGMDNDDDYYDEVTPSGEVVARYHSYHHMSIYPPQRTTQGWKKYDLDGNVIASGKTHF
ncbi:hypothetical protein [Gallaecimonas mangrovi]|uniref:hypothetical protein n=1 Tax=Gallaecimonas mangrovi TaxID=2291597 RepID=UPI000E209CEC|nr:hypothetical protein [Gallaecimonas mangrovi]